MRTFRHWRLRYIADRIAWEIYQRRNMDKPWLTPVANEVLDTLILPTDIGLEWGSGRSTCWFAKRLKHLTSVEDNPVWYERVKKQIADLGLANVSYRLLTIENEEQVEASAYVSVCDDFEDESLGFVLIDGSARDACACAVIPKIKRGGLLVIDNINWFLDHSTTSPSSRQGLGPVNQQWAQFEERVAEWRMIWSSSGITDTAIWIRPPR
jgi:hypothetical protein